MFIVIGSGLFKTCISVMVGALYPDGDGRRDAGFTLFYMGINIGALFASLIVGIFKEQGMWHVGFGVGGFGMLVALLLYRFYAHASLKNTLKKITSPLCGSTPVVRLPMWGGGFWGGGGAYRGGWVNYDGHHAI